MTNMKIRNAVPATMLIASVLSACSMVTPPIVTAQNSDSRTINTKVEDLSTLQTAGPWCGNSDTGSQLRNISYNDYVGLTRAGAADAIKGGCKAITVAVIDTGWNDADQLMAGDLLPRESWFDAYRGTTGSAIPAEETSGTHGAAVMSVLAGPGSISRGIVRILPIMAQKTNGTIDDTAIKRAMEYAAGGTSINGKYIRNPYPAQIINMSFGAPRNDAAWMADYARKVAEQGIIIVTATGNSGELGQTPMSLAPYTIGVGGITASGDAWQRSGIGNGATVAGPAHNVPTPQGGDAARSGTSMATPYVSAQLATWMYLNQQRTGSATLGLKGLKVYQKAEECLISAGSIGETGDSQIGHGYVDSKKLLDPDNKSCS